MNAFNKVPLSGLTKVMDQGERQSLWRGLPSQETCVRQALLRHLRRTDPILASAAVFMLCSC